MKTESKKRFKRTLLIVLAAAIVVFAGRFSYELSRDRSYLAYAAYETGMSNSFFAAEMAPMANYASSRVTLTDRVDAAAFEQKYEQVASMDSNTLKFDEDEQTVKQIIMDKKMVVQAENNWGLPGGRNLSLTLGVAPENFDDAVDLLKVVGNNFSFVVNKTDKTTEFRNLMSQRASLENTRNAYIELKVAGGTLNDQISLQEKILDVERQLQDLGVQIGEYSEENSLCTISFTLTELSTDKPASVNIGFVFDCAISAGAWTIAVCIAAAFVILGLMAFVLLVLFLQVKIRFWLDENKKG